MTQHISLRALAFLSQAQAKLETIHKPLQINIQRNIPENLEAGSSKVHPHLP
jgi:hypothetical protein